MPSPSSTNAVGDRPQHPNVNHPSSTHLHVDNRPMMWATSQRNKSPQEVSTLLEKLQLQTEAEEEDVTFTFSPLCGGCRPDSSSTPLDTPSSRPLTMMMQHSPCSGLSGAGSSSGGSSTLSAFLPEDCPQALTPLVEVDFSDVEAWKTFFGP